MCNYCAAACNECGRQVFSGEKPEYPGGKCSSCHFGLNKEGSYFPAKEHLDNCAFCQQDIKVQ